MTTKSRSEKGVLSPLTIDPARKITPASGYFRSKISAVTWAV